MTALYIILGIVAVIVLILSIRLSVTIEYREMVDLNVQWLFTKKKLLPLTTKPKKSKKKDAEEAKESIEEIGDTISEPDLKPENADDADKLKEDAESSQKKSAVSTKKKPPSLIKSLWEDHGYDGLVKMLKDTLHALNTFLGKILFSIVVEDMQFVMRVSKGDAAATAIEYGKVCAELYPLFGDIVSKMKVRTYDINIFPDYMANKSQTYLYAKLTVSPRKVLNCTLGLLFRLLFKVVLKVLIKLLKKPKSNQKNTHIPITSKGGASQ